jgi:hypothetical protein
MMRWKSDHWRSGFYFREYELSEVNAEHTQPLFSDGFVKIQAATEPGMGGLAEVGKGKVWVSAKEAGRAHLMCSPLPAGRVIAVATNARQDRT